MRGNLDPEAVPGRFALSYGDDLEALCRGNLPRNDPSSCFSPSLNEQLETKQLAFWRPAFRKRQEIRASRSAQPGKRRVDNGLVSAIDPHLSPKFDRIRQHLLKSRAVRIGLSRRAVGQHGFE